MPLHRGDACRVGELGADHQARPADLDDARAARELASPAVSCSPAPDVVEEAGLAHHLDRRQRRRAADRVAAVRAAMAALRPRSSSSRRVPSAENGKAGGDALGHADDVGLDAEVLDREHLAGATEPALHLVGDEQDPVLAAPLDEPLEERFGAGT